MKKILSINLIFGALLLFSTSAFSQTDSTTSEEPVEQPSKNQPERSAFESTLLVNEHTVTVPQAKTLEFMIQHRFGTLGNKEFDMFGLYAPSNIRLGLGYAITDRIMVGIGSTKFNKEQDLNYKVALLRQTKSGSMPVSVTYVGTTSVSTRKADFPDFTSRLSFFNQILIARRFNGSFSLQIGGSYSHYNILDSVKYHNLKHDVLGVSLGGRYKFSPQSSIIFEYSTPIGTPEMIKPNAALGLEVATSGHAFQIFLSTFDAILPQADYAFNTNDFTKKGLLLGFNITRLWGF